MPVDGRRPPPSSVIGAASIAIMGPSFVMPKLVSLVSFDRYHRTVRLGLWPAAVVMLGACSAGCAGSAAPSRGGVSEDDAAATAPGVEASAHLQDPGTGGSRPPGDGSACASTATGAAPSGQEALSFAPQARILFRVVACGGDDPLPPRLDAAQVDAHCDKMNALVEKVQSGWLALARPFFAGLRPAGLPDKLVYPFGGGDLLWAVETFPDALEYTTISLEDAGDPRAIDTIDGKQLDRSYRVTQKNIGLQFRVSHSRTDNMAEALSDPLPSQLIFDLMALRVHGFEPVDLRYFRIEPSGDLRYLTHAELAATPPAAQKHLFDNMELVFRKQGGDRAEPARLAHHIAYDLEDSSLGRNPGLLTHLERKGKVAAMTKAASYLLWGAPFLKIRDYLLRNMVWMVSDSTGIPPRAAAAAGFAQDAYGRFEGPYLDASQRITADFVQLFKTQSRRDLPIIYGYPDAHHHWHLIVTRPAASATRDDVAATTAAAAAMVARPRAAGDASPGTTSPAAGATSSSVQPTTAEIAPPQ